VLGDLTLHEKGGAHWVDSDRQELSSRDKRAPPQFSRVVLHGDGVEVDDRVEAVVGLLEGNPVPQGAKVVAQLKRVGGGLDSREDAAPRLTHVCILTGATGPTTEGCIVKLLVTGGAGYIGGVVTAQLLAAGHEVVVVDDLSTGHADTLPAEVEFHELSVHDVARVLTPEEGFQGVLHFAAKIAAGESVVHPERYWQTNVLGSLALLDAVRAARVPRLVFSSTAAVYGTGDDAPLGEETPTRPTNPYGSSKLAVDLMISGECTAHGLGAVSLRYFNAAGAAGHLGERHDPETHLIPIALEVAAGRREKLLLFGEDYPTPDGTCIRDYIHVSDLAAAHLLALEASTPGRHQVFNLGNGTGFTNREVIEVVREVTGHPIPVESAPRREGDAVAVVASSAKAQAELGWKPARPSLIEIVGDAWAFYRERIGA
jgi:UDP-glucose 4-epimerase